MTRMIPIAVLSALLAGCAAAPLPPAAPGHPANPDAPTTPLPRVTDLRADMPGQQSPSTTQAAAIYSCPMHPEVTGNEPGKCPKCGMSLVKKGGQ